jgi:hypothetical protein
MPHAYNHTPWQDLTLAAAAMALVLARRSPSDVRRARFARVVRYCRARGLRGPLNARYTRYAASQIAARFDAADRF